MEHGRRSTNERRTYETIAEKAEDILVHLGSQRSQALASTRRDDQIEAIARVVISQALHVPHDSFDVDIKMIERQDRPPPPLGQMLGSQPFWQTIWAVSPARATRQGGYLAVLLGSGAGGDGQLKGAKFTELRRAIEHENFAGGELGFTPFCSSHPI